MTTSNTNFRLIWGYDDAYNPNCKIIGLELMCTECGARFGTLTAALNHLPDAKHTTKGECPGYKRG